MIPLLAFTIAVGNDAARQARLLRTTFKAAHPEVPFLLVDGPLYARLARQPGAAHAGEIMAMRAAVGRFLSRFVSRIAYFDADVLVLAPLPRLLGEEGPAVRLTGDAAASAGLGATLRGGTLPPINAGVLSAADPDFWTVWHRMIAVHLLPLVGNFFDQYALRLMASAPEGQGPVACARLPEAAENDYYNVGALDAPGPWGRDGAFLTKGAARVRIWHWAGFAAKPGIEALPLPAQELLRERIEAGRAAEAATRESDTALTTELFSREKLEPFLDAQEAELATLPTQCLEGTLPIGGAPPEGLWGTDLPAAWEEKRPVPAGFHRRLLPHAPRWLYARSEARLHAADVARYDRALWTGGA